VAVSAYNVVETLGSTETGRSHANNEDINVTVKMINVRKISFASTSSIFKYAEALSNIEQAQSNSHVGHGGGIR
jgi:hypothetical protein